MGTVERGVALRSRVAASGRWGQIFVAVRRGLLLMGENPGV